MADQTKPSVYCSTSGTFFTDKEELAEHYKSDFHRYNLKRKIAGLPPVTKEWFDSRKEQLSSSASLSAVQNVWLEPLTKKRFSSENTYQAFTRSKKYQDLVRKSGQPAPPPAISTRKTEPAGAEVRQDASGAQPRTHTIKPPSRGPSALSEAEDNEKSDWETASEDEDMEEADSAQAAQEWDVRRSLFDNQLSDSLEANLEYMWKLFGFYLPDAEFLTDPEGLVKYLGAKLSEGHIPLYASGLDANAKQLGSLHAVQSHMVDTNQCKMVYDGVEEEYDDYYDYSKALDGDAPEGRELVMAGGEEPAALATSGYELVLPDKGGKAGKILGTREFAKYYRQRHRQPDARRSTQISMLQQRYRNLGVALLESPGEAQSNRAAKQAQKQQRKGDRLRLRTDLQANVNRNLPRNVPY